MITSVDIVLTSADVAPPKAGDGLVAFAACLQRMDGLPNHVRASWRGNDADLLTETSINSGVWTAMFFDVPVGLTNTMTVHDVSECARNPAGNGHVTMGITVNGTVVDRVVGSDNTLFFDVTVDGTVGFPPVMVAPSP